MSEFTKEQLVMAHYAPKREPVQKNNFKKVVCVSVGIAAGITATYFLAPRIHKAILLRRVAKTMAKVGAQ